MSKPMLSGRFRPPGDKSVSHRVALFSLLACGDSLVKGFSTCADCQSTLAAVSLLGGRVTRRGQDLLIEGAEGALSDEAEVDCGNSGTTIRMLQGLLCGRSGTYRLDGDASLRRRPMERVAAPLRAMGADVRTTDGRPPVTIYGRPLHGATITMPVASAQLKTALLLAGLQAEGSTRIVEPAPSRDHSERILRAWGADLTQHADGLSIQPGLLQMAAETIVPGDASGAAFFLCGASIVPGSSVTAEEVMLNPSRTGWMDVLESMGATLSRNLAVDSPEPFGAVTARYCDSLRGCEVPAEVIPNIVDEVPILALVATQARGRTVFHEVGELRVKESDRLEAIVTELSRFGARIHADGDDLIVDGPTELRAPQEACMSYADHRVAMTLRVASLLCSRPVAIENEECAAVSYPDFADTFARLRRRPE